MTLLFQAYFLTLFPKLDSKFYSRKKCRFSSQNNFRLAELLICYACKWKKAGKLVNYQIMKTLCQTVLYSII